MISSPENISCSLNVLTRGKPWPRPKYLTTLLNKTLLFTLQEAFQAPSLLPFFRAFSQYNLEINLLLAHNSFVKKLNRIWRHRDTPTNVLSFPSFDKERKNDSLPSTDLKEKILLGEIVLSYETCLEETNIEKPFLNHIQHLFLHGTLHLLGFDHEHESDAKIMEALEVKILGYLSIPNPYPHITPLHS